MDIQIFFGGGMQKTFQNMKFSSEKLFMVQSKKSQNEI